MFPNILFYNRSCSWISSSQVHIFFISFLRNQPAMVLRLTFFWICCQPCSKYSYDWPVPEELTSHIPTAWLFLNILPTMFLPLLRSWRTDQTCSYNLPVPKYSANYVLITRPLLEYPANRFSTTRMFLKNRPAMFLQLAHSIPEYPYDHVPTTRPFLNILPTIFLPLACSEKLTSHISRTFLSWYPANHVSTTHPFLRNQPAMLLRLLNMLLTMTDLFLNILPTMFLPFACSWGTGQLCSYDWPVPEYPALVAVLLHEVLE
jgi:hypothetical protein